MVKEAGESLNEMRLHFGHAAVVIPSLVIPGRHAVASPESIAPALGLWIPDLPLRGNPE